MMQVNEIQKRLLLRLLEVKDIDIRIMILEQAYNAVDKGLHAGGAFSAIIPLTALYYGDIIQYDVENPTSNKQDLFILSKGHAVASIAAIYADLGYFDRSILKNSRSFESILNGHPGPILPGIHTATGPMGQGICVAGGLACAGQLDSQFDVFAMTGDGELQEGSSWEAIMYAGSAHNENLCVIVDNNNGQLDTHTSLHLDMSGLAKQFAAFGWRVFDVDGMSYESVYDALYAFKWMPRTAAPTVIISRTKKGWGSLASELTKHKTTVPKALLDSELVLQKNIRAARVAKFFEMQKIAISHGVESEIATLLDRVKLAVSGDNLVSVQVPVLTKPAAPRNKNIEGVLLPELDTDKEYLADQIVSTAMELYGKDPRVVTIDSDLSSTSGLQRGLSTVDRRRALNVGIAEANMMAMGEGFALLGYNTWVSTFCPFFSWNVLRRIAVSYQERMEVIASGEGWLTEGHGLDLTFLATAPNFETKTNGATHMGNDDALVYSGIAHLKIIDTSCPNQLLEVIRWIMEGNRGLVYLRVMRAGSKIIYKKRPKFIFGEAYTVHGDLQKAEICIISSGRGVHEAIAAAEMLQGYGYKPIVIDMPSVDKKMFTSVCESNIPILFAEQNNGYLYAEFQRTICSAGASKISLDQIHAINTLDKKGQAQFIHSATYQELTEAYGLSPQKIADTCKAILEK